MTPPEEQANINALSNLLALKGLDAGDFIDVINALSNIKQRDAAKEENCVKQELESHIIDTGSKVSTSNRSMQMILNIERC